MTNWKKNITLFLTGQTISLFGSMLVQYAISWYITLQTQSGVMLTISIICGFLPTFFISMFAGVWADRYNRKKMIIIADSFIAISTLILAILFLYGYNYIWLLFVVSAFRSIGAGIQMPAVGAILPQLVPAEKLTKVNAVSSSIQSLSMLLAPMLSGLMLTFASIEFIFFIDVFTALLAVIIMLFFVKVTVHAKALMKQTTGYFADLKIGLNYIKNHNFVKTFLVFSAVFMFLASPVAFLTPLQVTRDFGSDVWRLTAIEIAFSVGMLSGGIIIASWGGFKNKVHTMTLASFFIGFCTIALGVIPNFWIYLAFMALCGMSIPVFNTPTTVLLQQKVEGDYLGRVFGVMGMISSFMMPLGMLIFGPVADFLDIKWLLIGTGAFMIIQSLFMLKNKILITAGKPVLQEVIKQSEIQAE